MKKNWLLGCLALGLILALAPAVTHADEVGVGFNVDLGADDSAHFGFGVGHHEPMIYKAAQNLQAAKHVLWNAPHRGEAKVRAIHRINDALDQLRWVENHPGAHRREAVMRAKQAANDARRILWNSGHGEAKHEAMDHLNRAVDIFNRILSRSGY